MDWELLLQLENEFEIARVSVCTGHVMYLCVLLILHCSCDWLSLDLELKCKSTYLISVILAQKLKTRSL